MTSAISDQALKQLILISPLNGGEIMLYWRGHRLPSGYRKIYKVDNKPAFHERELRANLYRRFSFYNYPIKKKR